MNEPLQSTLVDAVHFLKSQRVPYALVGGLAASLRGQPRVTADVDLVIRADIERTLEMTTTLENSSFRPLFDGVEEVVRSAFILPLRHRSTGVKVDMALGLSGFEQEIISRAQTIELAGADVQLATAEDLIVMKALAARPQDEQDIRGLILAGGERLDWQHCLRLASELGEATGQDLLGRIQLLREDA